MTINGSTSSQGGAVNDAPPPVLFKFRRFPSLAGLTNGRLDDAKWQRDQVIQILRGQLRLAKPDSFNDPFEFRPAVTLIEGSTTERAKGLRRFVQGALRTNLSFKKRMKIRANSTQIDRVAGNLDTIMARSLQEMRNEIELYCVSANETRPLLWSHYADGHRGIALHFDGSKPPFNLAWRVTYSRIYPTVVAGGERSASEDWERLRASLLVKDQDWSYEDEWRLLAPLSDNSVSLLQRWGVTHKDGFLHVDPRVVVGVTLGAKMPADAEAELRTFLSKERSDIAVRRASMAQGRFEIEIGDA